MKKASAASSSRTRTSRAASGTTVTTWEDNAYEDGEVIPAP